MGLFSFFSGKRKAKNSRRAAALRIEPLEDRSLPSCNTISGYVFQDANNNGIMDAGELPIAGEHNQLNAQGAFAAARLFGVTWDDAQRAMREFAPLPHRLQLVHESTSAVPAIAVSKYRDDVKGCDLLGIKPVVSFRVADINRVAICVYDWIPIEVVRRLYRYGLNQVQGVSLAFGV